MVTLYQIREEYSLVCVYFIFETQKVGKVTKFKYTTIM